jgi:hypothetical protein
MRSRVLVGRDVSVVREWIGGLDLAGRVRLRPGHPVEVVRSAVLDRPPVVRKALVWSWAIVSLGSGGPIYGGSCRWE